MKRRRSDGVEQSMKDGSFRVGKRYCGFVFDE
jgi:hypothetical protein